MANLKPFRTGFDPRRNLTGRNGKAELAHERITRLAALIAALSSPVLSDREYGGLLRTIASAFIENGLVGDPVTVRRIVDYSVRCGF